jgi:hypothetical protein
MKKLVPTTQGVLAVTLRRKRGAITAPAKWSRFGGIRDEVNLLLAAHDDPDDPVEAIKVEFAIEEGGRQGWGEMPME